MRNHFWDIPKGIHEESTLANWQLSWASCSSQLQIAQSELLIKMRRNFTKLHGKEHLVKFDSLVLIRKRRRLDCRIPRNSSCSAQPPKIATRSEQALGTKGSATSGNE